MATYLKFRGSVYRKADRRMDEILSRQPGKNITWGPDEWPSDEYLETMKEKPPLSKADFLFLQRQVQELQDKAAQEQSPVEKRVLLRSISMLEHKIIQLREWLYNQRPSTSYRLKHWAKSE
jgi:hypothetical protein